MQTLFKVSMFFYLISVTLSSCLYCFSSDKVPANEKYDPPCMISVYRTETGTVTMVPFEHYTACVVASEIPASFHMEAIKAQAVAARTYAAAKVYSAKASGCPDEHPLAPVCDSVHCQVYRDFSELQKSTGWSKITEAVTATESQLLYYDGSLVMHALFHASSGGKTENSEDIFVSAVPYLKSVSSPYEPDFPRSGHGVGMSQQGANGMADAGYDYREILSHYYTGTRIY